ncbi:MAG: ATP-binding protein, partial [Acidimicrobiales bacterium]
MVADLPAGADDWTCLADALLIRAAVRFRARRDRSPDPFAGLHIDAATADRLIGELLGSEDRPLDGDEALDKAVDEARVQFAADLGRHSPFAALVGAASVGREEAEVLSLLCAVELDPRRAQLVAYLNDDVTRRRPTLHLLRSLFDVDHPGALAVAGDARLSRAELVEVAGEGPWADRSVSVHDTVIWALAGDRSPDPALPVGLMTLVAPDESPGGAPLVVVAGGDRV